MTAQRLPLAYGDKLSLYIAVLSDGLGQPERWLPAVRHSGFEAHGMASALELYRTMLTEPFDVVVLDAELPDESGFDVARHLRAISEVGIMMLISPQRRQDALRALHSGADFYLPKPVDPLLLVALLENFSRRLTRVSSASRKEPCATRWRLKADDWRLVSPQGHRVELTAAERDILKALTQEDGEAVPREALIEVLTHNPYDFDPHRLEMIIHRLRRKVLTRTGETLPLRTVRGKGYLLAWSHLSPSYGIVGWLLTMLGTDGFWFGL